MKSLNMIQKLSKIGRILSKIAFIGFIVGFCGCIVGLLSLNFGADNLIKIGGVTLRDLIVRESGYSLESIGAAFSGWMVVCAGEAVLAKFAELYFRNEWEAGTPFTFAGARELLRLGILTIAIPTGCVVVGSIVEGIVAGFLDTAKATAMDSYFNNESSVMLGIALIVVSLIFRYGAELKEGDSHEKTSGME